MNHTAIFLNRKIRIGRNIRWRTQPRKPPRRKRLLRRKRSSLGRSWTGRV